MFWLRRPPYLRWIGAGVLLLIGLVMDLRGPAVERYPFAAEPIGPGDAVTSAIEWRDVPVGLLPEWRQPVSGVMGTNLAAGDPVLPSSLADVTVPEQWWSVSLPLPVKTAPGTSIRVRQPLTGELIEGVVVDSGADNGFGVIGMVAFPATHAAKVADAAAADALVVMVGHRGGAAAGDG